MELSEIRTFVAVAESGSINRAARTLSLSQPAVTRQVQRLEAALGVKLLDRRAKPVTLTPAGQAALEKARLIFKAVGEFHAAAAPSQGPAGDCRIGVAHALADVALAEPINHLRRAFPRVTFQVTTDWSRVLLERLRSGGLDIAVVQLPAGTRPPADTPGRLIATQRLVFVAPRHRRLPRELDLADLAEATWVLNPDGCGFRAALGRSLQRVNAPLRIAVEAYGSELQLSLVARGVGLGLVPARVLARSRLRRRLRVLRVRGHDFQVAAWTVRGRLPEPLAPVLEALDRELVRILRAAG